MEQRWSGIDRGKGKDSEKNLPQCHFVYNKSHLGANPGHRCENPLLIV
jgi:hypothetical protein